MRREFFVAKMTELAEVFGAKLSAVAFEVYWRIISPRMADEELEAAVDSIVATKVARVMPTPGEILSQYEASKAERALLAWDQVVKAARKYDIYETIVFEDKTIHAVIEHLGGWEKVCDLAHEDGPWAKKDFQELYRAFDGRDMGAPAKITGFHDYNNEQYGWDRKKKPVVIPIHGRATPKVVAGKKPKAIGA